MSKLKQAKIGEFFATNSSESPVGANVVECNDHMSEQVNTSISQSGPIAAGGGLDIGTIGTGAEASHDVKIKMLAVDQSAELKDIDFPVR